MASMSSCLTFSSSTTTTTNPFPLQTKFKSSRRRIFSSSRVSCNNSGDNNKDDENKMMISKGNRRDVLIGLGGGLGAAASFTYNRFAAFAMEVVTDQRSCKLPDLKKPVSCCPPTLKFEDANHFVFPTDQHIRVRKPAHLVTGEDLEKYKEAIRIMRSLPPDHPHSFTHQANIHCAYCHDSYGLVKSDDKSPPKVRVHSNWLFAPFHRWYLYFYERILGKLIKDPTFALPFWNWDHPDGMYIPDIFIDSESPLFDAKRNCHHYPRVLFDLDWNKNSGQTTGDVRKNEGKVNKSIAGKPPEIFLGKGFKDGPSSGSLERLHNAAHIWTGDPKNNGEDMGHFYSSGRDPLFYCHHSNVDRLWTIWKDKFGGSDFSDQDYRNSSFLFYDENENLVRVTTEQCLDPTKLGYKYDEEVDIPWKDFVDEEPPSSAEPVLKSLSRPPKKALKTPELPLVLDSVKSFAVNRPSKSRSKEEKANKEEILVFEVTFDTSQDVKFDVLLFWQGDTTQASPKNREFAGSFVSVSLSPSANDFTEKYQIEITDLLDKLAADDEDSIEVTLVPRFGDVPVTINKASVTYLEH